ncbi:FAD/NAD(P)-binding domain-containing protein [Periconia macrospinosa]|uniref:FAD/NAD(P)-binding domain-containing protein n=1 Tax=Periconia macrospinosa TaxID=97972 RepID=A0A2V1D9N5_9PLEO|nr:FAD/NAD(P)-binding domain-containing protein [Periconia macrospinosa]
MPEKKVLIIGAGLGGLVLAHVLHKNNIPVEIFERDENSFSRKQGWAVVLIECLPHLKKALPDALVRDLYTNSVNHNTGDLDEIGFINALTGEKVGSTGGVPQGQDGHILRVSRLGLRSFLLENGNLPISLGKHFTHYEEHEGFVTAFFKDGTSRTGSLLVGADGVHSYVMKQLVGAPNHRPVLSKWVPVFGEVKLPKEQYEPLRKLGTAVVLEIMKGQHPVLTDVIRLGGPGALVTTQPKFLEYVTPEDMPRGRVTVLGDAAHAMVPIRGAGANTAILDACDLGDLIVRAHQAGTDFASVVGKYLEIMVPRGREMVLSSRAAGEQKEDTIEEWVARFQRPRESTGKL